MYYLFYYTRVSQKVNGKKILKRNFSIFYLYFSIRKLFVEQPKVYPPLPTSLDHTIEPIMDNII